MNDKKYIMNEIIKIIEKDGKKAVNARELHAFLESKQEFANWIKGRIEKYGFIENQDYEVFDNFIKNPAGGRPTIDYALSIDMAKELSMVENNEKGRLARKYFIECENIARGYELVPAIEQKLRNKMMFADWTSKFLNLNEASKLGIARRIGAEVGLDDALPQFVDAGTVNPTTHAAKDLLKEHGVSLSVIAFNKKLEEKGIVKTATRAGSGGKTHSWKVLQPGYDKYGQNTQDPKFQSQTQIRWYDNSFGELLCIAGVNKELQIKM